MDELTIPIPDGMSEDQKTDLTAWLTHLAEQIFVELDKGRPMREAIHLVSERHGLQPPA